MCETAVRDGLCRLVQPGSRWLATGPDGGYVAADAADNLTVPTGFDRTDLATYVASRRERAGLSGDGPALLTGVDVAHARGAKSESVTVVATAGLSNPAVLPMETDGTGVGDGPDGEAQRPGTVNLLVATSRALDDGTLATLLATVVEAKTATLLPRTGFTGTTSDAVAVGTAPAGEPAAFAGSGTDLGHAARACVRDAIRESLAARYADRPVPPSVATADHGSVTTAETETFRP